MLQQITAKTYFKMMTLFRTLHICNMGRNLRCHNLIIYGNIDKTCKYVHRYHMRPDKMTIVSQYPLQPFPSIP